jgi:hypothetical protein
MVGHSAIVSNSALLTTDFPRFFGGQFQDLVANTGGLVAGPGVTATTFENTLVTGNSAIARDLHGEPSAIDAGLNINSGSLRMADSIISRNRAITQSATSADVGGAGSVLEVDGGGTITHTLITGNRASMVSRHGVAAVTGAGLGLFGDTSLLTVQNSIIAGNTAAAASSTGSATSQGAGVFNNGLLKLVRDRIDHNSGTATGPSGQAQGAGIWNGAEFAGPPVHLTLQSTTVTRNSLTGSPGVTVQGGGVYTAPPATITLGHSLIAHNVPDQCFGC